MLSNIELKNLKKLAQKKYRISESAYVIEGLHGVNEAIKSASENIEYILHSPDIQILAPEHITRYSMPIHKLESVSQMKKPPGILAKMRISQPPALSSDIPLLFYLADIQDPGNLGTIIRTAEWFGQAGLLLSSRCVDPYSPKVVQASMGSIHRVSLYRETEDYILEDLLGQYPLYGTSMDGLDYRDLELPARAIIIIGNESHGMSPRSMELIGHSMSIPSRGRAESLNASITHAILSAYFSA